MQLNKLRTHFSEQRNYIAVPSALLRMKTHQSAAVVEQVEHLASVHTAWTRSVIYSLHDNFLALQRLPVSLRTTLPPRGLKWRAC